MGSTKSDIRRQKGCSKDRHSQNCERSWKIQPRTQKGKKIYFWEKGFIEDKEDETTLSPKKTILRKNDLRKSGQALTKQLKEKIKAEMGSTKSEMCRQKGCSEERHFSQERKRYILGKKDSSRIT